MSVNNLQRACGGAMLHGSLFARPFGPAPAVPPFRSATAFFKCVRMHKPAIFSLLAIIIVAFSRLTAQVPAYFPDAERVYIVSSDGLLDPIDLKSSFYKTQLDEQWDPPAVQEIIRLGRVESWPAHLRSSDMRARHGHFIVDYVAYYIGDVIDEQEESVALLYVPQAENLHMPAGMQSPADFIIPVYDYLVSDEPTPDPAVLWSFDDETGLQADGTTIVPGTPVEIINPGLLYSDYNLAADPNAQNLIAQYSDNPDFIKEMAGLAHENNWPVGIRTHALRNKTPSPLMAYKLYYYGQIGDKVIVVSRADENAAIQDPQLRSEKPIVFVFGLEGIRVME